MLQKFAAQGLTRLKVVDIRSSTVGVVKHLIELDREQAAKIPKEYKMVPRRSRAEGKPSMWFESEGCEVCNTILSHDAFLVSGKSLEEHAIMYNFMVPTFDAYTGIIRALEASGHKVTVVKMGKFEPKLMF